MPICPNCGWETMDWDIMYCVKCGRVIPIEIVKKKKDKRILTG